MLKLRYLIPLLLLVLILSGLPAKAEGPGWGEIPNYDDVTFKWAQPVGVQAQEQTVQWRIHTNLEATSMQSVQQAVQPLQVLVAQGKLDYGQMVDSNFFPSSGEFVSLANNLTSEQVTALEALGYTVSKYEALDPVPDTIEYRWLVDEQRLRAAAQEHVAFKVVPGNIVDAENHLTASERESALFLEKPYGGKTRVYFSAGKTGLQESAANPLANFFPPQDKKLAAATTITYTVEMTRVMITDLTDEQKVLYGLPISGTVTSAATYAPSPGRSYARLDEPGINQKYSPDMDLYAIDEFPIVTAVDGVGSNIPSEGLPTLVIMDWLGQKQMSQPLPGSIQSGDLHLYDFGCSRYEDEPHGLQMLETAMGHIGDGKGAFGFNGIQSRPRAWVYPIGGCKNMDLEYTVEVAYDLVYEAFSRGDLKMAVVTNSFGWLPEEFWPQGIVNAVHRLQASPYDVQVFASSGNEPGRLTPKIPAIVADNCTAGLWENGLPSHLFQGCKDAEGRAIAAASVHGVTEWNGNGWTDVMIAGTSVSAQIAGTMAIWNHGVTIGTNPFSSLNASWQKMRNGFSPAGTGPNEEFWGWAADPRAVRGKASEYGSMTLKVYIEPGKFLSGIRVVDDYKMWAVTANFDNTVARAQFIPIKMINNKLSVVYFEPGTDFIWVGVFPLNPYYNGLFYDLQLRFGGYSIQTYLPLILK